MTAAAFLKADGQRHSDSRHHHEREDGDSECQHEPLVHGDVALRGPGTHHHTVSPAVRHRTTVPHTQLLDPHCQVNLLQTSRGNVLSFISIRIKNYLIFSDLTHRINYSQ